MKRLKDFLLEHEGIRMLLILLFAVIRMLLMLLFAVLVVALIVRSGDSSAKPIAIMQHQGIVVTLTDEPCAFRSVVDMPYRATWQESGKHYEGCFSVHQQAGVVVAYFAEDRSIALIPLQYFSRAASTGREMRAIRV